MGYREVVLADNPAAYWRLGESSGTAAADAASGSAHPGVYAGSPTLGVAGLIVDPNTAAYFDGVDDKVTVAGGAWTTSNELTWEAWIKLDTLTPETIIGGQWGAATADQRFLAMVTTDGRARFPTRDPGGTFQELTSAAGLIAAGARCHVVMAYNFPGQTKRMYVNGVLVGSATIGTGLKTSSAASLVIAGQAGAAPPALKGTVDEVAFYTHELSAARVLAHYNEGLTPTVTAPGPPTSVVGTATSSTTATLTWAAPTTGGSVTGYDVRLDGGAATSVGVDFDYDFTGLAPLTAYTLAVRATGPGGSSAWVSVVVNTPDVPLTADYRVMVRLGTHEWTADAGDPPELGPILPVSFGWAVPEDALGFPAQPDPDVANLELVTADYSDMAGVDIGTTMRVSFYVPGDTRPLATFRGRVADMEASPHPMGLSWRVLGVGYFADTSSAQVGTSDWPQESGDDRAARIMAEAGYPGWTAPTIGSTFESRQARATTARAELEALTDAAVSAEGTAYGPPRRVLVYPVTAVNGDLTDAAPFKGAAVLRRTDALDVVSAGLVNRNTSWRRTKLLDAKWVRIDHPGGPTTYGDTRGPAYPPQSVPVTDPRELADLILDTTPGYRWLTGQALRLELWAGDDDELDMVSHWFYRDPDSPPFPWSGRAVVVEGVANSPDGSSSYAGMLTAATMRLEHVKGAGGRLVVEFRLRPDIPAQSTVTMRWMDEPVGATWADELATDPTGTWYDYYTRPRP